MNQYAIFLQFLRRDWYAFSRRTSHFFVNYWLIYPALFSLMYCYLLPSLSFELNNPTKNTTIFIGHILIMTVVLAFSFTIPLLFDFENNRFVDYQITILKPRLLILERILFRSLFILFLTLPFFPLAKLYMQQLFVTENSSWVLVFIMLLISALCCCSYMQCMICLIPSSRTIRRFWMRVNFMLITFGGLFIPWKTIAAFSPLLGYLILLNPLLYITEGMRNALLNSSEFLPTSLCIFMLSLYTVIFTFLAFYFFKKRIDHI